MIKYGNNSEIVIDYIVLENYPEIRKWIRMIILKNNSISIVKDRVYGDFLIFKYLENIIFEMVELVENKAIAE